MKILVLNAGSSSQKSRLYDIGGDTLPELAPPALWKAETDGKQLTVTTAAGTWSEDTIGMSSESIKSMLETLWSGPHSVISSSEEINFVGHRVVHGGPNFRQSTRIDADVKAAIEHWAELAPSHNPAALQGMEVVEQLLGAVPQLAVFDTAFHRTLSDAAAIYPGPYDWVEQGIRRYGFHGINHEYCARRATQILKRDPADLRLITCHLGNGCSLAAIQGGRSVDTTMGFTPLEGLMMGTRSGSVDPAIVLYLLRHGHTADAINRMLNKESGLKGIAGGGSGDMRDIMAGIERGDKRTKLAFDMYVHRLRFHVGAMLAALGGLDALVFTGGVGENSTTVRSAVCEAFAFLDMELDAEQNEKKPVDADIATVASKVRILVIQAQEDWAIAQECWRFARTE